MMVDLALDIHENEPYRQKRFGAALEQIFINLAVIAATGEGEVLSVSKIVTRLQNKVPRTNVNRHLKELAAVGRVRAVGTSYVANLDTLDTFMTPDRLERVRRLVSATARKVSR